MSYYIRYQWLVRAADPWIARWIVMDLNRRMDVKTGHGLMISGILWHIVAYFDLDMTSWMWPRGYEWTRPTEILSYGHQCWILVPCVLPEAAWFPCKHDYTRGLWFLYCVFDKPGTHNHLNVVDSSTRNHWWSPMSRNYQTCCFC